MYAGQYQQRPTPAGGAIFRGEWFRYFDELPSGLEERTQSWDMSFKDKQDNDYVVGLVAGRRGSDVYLIDRVKGQWAFSESCRQVEALRAKIPGIPDGSDRRRGQRSRDHRRASSPRVGHHRRPT